MSRRPALSLLTLCLVLLVVACGGAPPSASEDRATNSSAPAAVEGRPAPGAPPVAPAGTAAPAARAEAKPAEAARPAGGTSASAPAAKPADAAAKPASEPVKPGQAPNAALPSDQKIIRTGRIDLIVADISESLRAITRLMTTTGGYIQQSATREQGNTAIAELTLRVPVEQYDGVFQQLRDLAVPDKKPIESSDAQDVTEEFADTQARITNLKATEAQLLRLMSRAEKMEDILVVQRELTSVREQIERLQGRLNVIERRAAFSTITVSLRPQPEARRPSPPVLQSPVMGARDLTARPVFSWATSEGATSYTLQVTTEVDTTFASPLVNADKLTVTQFELPGEELRLGAVYRWRVRASNASGDGEWAAPRVFSVVPGWNPFRTVEQSWAASLRFLQVVIDRVLQVAVFFWWLVPIVALAVLMLRFLLRSQRRAGPPGPPAAPLTALGAAAPPSAPSPGPPAGTPPTTGS